MLSRLRRLINRRDERRSYDLFLDASAVVVIGFWITMTALGRFPLVAHVFSAIWVGLQLFVRWRQRHPADTPADTPADMTADTRADMDGATTAGRRPAR